MKSRLVKRFLCILMSLCLLMPAFALAEGEAPETGLAAGETSSEATETSPELLTEEEQPAEEAEPSVPVFAPDPEVDYTALWPILPENAIRAKYELRASVNPEAYPEGGDIHYADWAKFIEKLSLSGDIDVYNFPHPASQFNHTGWLNLKGKPLISLDMDAVDQHRYLRSNACKGDTIFFHMDNFLEFMTKPSYFGIDLKPASLIMYPEAAMYLVETYEDCFAPYFTGEGTRIISYEDLSLLCADLNALAPEGSHANRLYRFVNNLLDELRISITAYDSLGMMDVYLDFLDPEKKGMLITVSENSETYEIGGRTLLYREWDEGRSSFVLTLPYLTQDYTDEVYYQEGSLLTLTYETRPGENSGRDMDIHLTVEGEGRTTMEVAFNAKGLPAEGETDAEGTLHLTVDGSYLRNTHQYDLAFSIHRSPSQAEGYTDHTDFTLSLLSAQTGLPELTVALTADSTPIPVSELKSVELRYDLPDFFRLNESVIKEYMDLYAKTAVLAMLPLVLEVPAGIINDIYALVENHDILPALGIY